MDNITDKYRQLSALWLDFIRREELNNATLKQDHKGFAFIEASAIEGDTLRLSPGALQDIAKRALGDYTTELELDAGSDDTPVFPDDIFLLLPLYLQQGEPGNKVFLPICAIDISESLETAWRAGVDLLHLPTNPRSFHCITMALSRIAGMDPYELDTIPMTAGLFPFVEALTGEEPETFQDALHLISRGIAEQTEPIQQPTTTIAIGRLSLANYSKRLQQDLVALEEEPRLINGSQIRNYLDTETAINTQSELDYRDSRWIGRFNGEIELSEGQDLALRRLTVDELLAVEGPPGTGKTALIAEICADRITRRALTLAQNNDLLYCEPQLLLVASDTGKAVENVIDLFRDKFGNRSDFWLEGGGSNKLQDELLRIEATIERLGNVIRAKKEEDLSDPAKEREELLDALSRLHSMGRDFDDGKKKRFNLECELEAIESSINRSSDVIRKMMERANRPIESHDIGVCSPTSLGTLIERGIHSSDIARIEAKLEIALEKESNAIMNRLLKRRTHLEQFQKETEELWTVLGFQPTQLAQSSLEQLITFMGLLQHSLERLEGERGHLSALRNEVATQEVKRETVKARLEQLEETPEQGSDYYRNYRFYPKTSELAEELFAAALRYLDALACQRAEEVRLSLSLYRAFLLGERGSTEAKRQFYAMPAWHLANISLVYPVFATTLNSLRSLLPLLEAPAFRVSIVDEASMVQVHKLIPVLGRSQKAVVIGDPRQLNAVVSLAKSQKAGYHENWASGGFSVRDVEGLSPANANAFQRAAARCAGQVILLEQHRRCEREIAETFVQMAGYPQITILEPPSLSLSRAVEEAAGATGLAGIQICHDNNPDVKYCRGEVKAIESLLKTLSKNGVDIRKNVAVLTPFRQQERALTEQLAYREKLLYPKQIGTVHKHQGRQAPIVIFSLGLRKEASGGLYFINKGANLLNVAVSRAMALFVTVGNLDEYAESGGALQLLIERTMTSGKVGVFYEHKRKELYSKDATGLNIVEAAKKWRECCETVQSELKIHSNLAGSLLSCSSLEAQLIDIRRLLKKGVRVSVQCGPLSEEEREGNLLLGELAGMLGSDLSFSNKKVDNHLCCDGVTIYGPLDWLAIPDFAWELRFTEAGTTDKALLLPLHLLAKIRE